ncbi:MAG: hypothetical protein ACR2MN_14175, partial [Acidimicrobiales bacterium]
PPASPAAPAAPSPTAPAPASLPVAEADDHIETGEDRETQQRWARLAAAEGGEAGGAPRRRRSRVFRDNDRPRRPLRSTQEANAVAARRKEQITGTSPGPSTTAPEVPDPPAAIAPEAQAPATGSDGPSGSTPTIRVSRAAAATDDPGVSAPAPPGSAGPVPAGATNGSAASQPTGSGNGTAPAGAGDERDEASDAETQRRGLRRRGRNKRKSGEG